MGQVFRSQFLDIQKAYPHIIKEVRGQGLLNAVELNAKGLSTVSAFDVCQRLKERGILAKPTHDTIIRFSPPLTIRLKELSEASKAFKDVLEYDLPKMQQQSEGNAPHNQPEACDRCGRVK